MTPTPARISVGYVSHLPASTPAGELAALMAADGQGLAAVALAEAAGRAPRAAGNLLASPEWCEDWLYTLTGLEGTLRVAVARAELNGDARKARANWRTALRVTERLPLARQAVNAARRQQMREWDHGGIPKPKTVDPAARSALAHRYGAEFGQLRWELLAADGLADLETLPVDENEFFTAAVRCGLLVPASTEAVALAALPWSRFRDLVAADIQDGHKINGLLRDPVVAHRWGRALVDLHNGTCDALGIATASPADDFPILSLNLRALPTEEAFRHIRQLRFLAGLRQRYVEQQRLARDLKHRASQRREGLALHAGDRAMDVLVERHRDVYLWLHAQLSAHADPATGLMPAGYRAIRKAVLADLFARLDRAEAATAVTA